MWSSIYPLWIHTFTVWKFPLIDNYPRELFALHTTVMKSNHILSKIIATLQMQAACHSCLKMMHLHFCTKQEYMRIYTRQRIVLVVIYYPTSLYFICSLTSSPYINFYIGLCVTWFQKCRTVFWHLSNLTDKQNTFCLKMDPLTTAQLLGNLLQK